MNDPMNNLALDRDLRALFSTGPRTAPASTLAAGLARAATVDQRRPISHRLDRRAWPPVRRAVSDPSIHRLARIALAAVLVLLVGAVLAFGARLLDRPPRVEIQYGAALDEFVLAPGAALWPDGRVLISGQGGTQILFDPATGDSTRLRFGPDFATTRSVDVLPDGRVIVIGSGDISDGRPLNVGRFDVQSETMTTLGDLGQRLEFSPSILVLRDGRVLISGGITFPGLEPPRCPESICEIPPTPRPTGPAEGPLATVEIFDPMTGATSELGPLAQPRWGHSMLELDDGRILIVGGNVASAVPALVDVEIYDVVAGTSRTAGRVELPPAPSSKAPIRLPDGRVLIPGPGIVEHPCGAPPEPTFPPVQDLHAVSRQATFVFDPRTGSVVDGPILPHYYGLPNIIPLPDGRALAFGYYTVTSGGCANDEDPHSKGWLGVIDVAKNRSYESFNPITGASSLPIDATHVYGAGVLLPDGRVLLVEDPVDQRGKNAVDIVTVAP